MKEKLINLIKKYRAKSEELWTPTRGYLNWTNRGISLTYDKCATDLEKLVCELPEDAGENCFYRGGHGCQNVRLDVPWESSK